MKKLSRTLSPLVAVDRKSAKPLHKQVYDAYRSAIIRGDLRSGQQVPSTRTLAVELGISRIPVFNAYAQLLAEGYLEGRTGAGTFVSISLPERPVVPADRREVAAAPGAAPRSLSFRSSLLPVRRKQPWIYGSGAFAVGHLAADQFPFQTWTNLLTRHARTVHASSLNYTEPMGSKAFREAIATYLRTSRAVRCEAEQIMVVSGSQQALDICARALLDPGSRVWIENPGYWLLRSALTLAGCQLVPVPVDGEGLDVAAGIRLCRNAQAAWVTPSHQFPLGAMMSASRRMQLLDWARDTGAWIIEDDYDSEYRYESMPIAALQGLDRDSRVIYIGTFSKALFPALRSGYMVIPADLVDRFAVVRSAIDVCPPAMYQAVLTDFIREGHFARHIRKMRSVYGERRDALAEAIRSEFGTVLEMIGGAAGMYLTVTLPSGFNDREIATRAAEHKLWLSPLSPTYLGENPQQGFILGFGGTPASEMPQAVKRMRGQLIGLPTKSARRAP